MPGDAGCCGQREGGGGARAGKRGVALRRAAELGDLRPRDLEEARQTSIDIAVTMPEPAYHATGGAAAAAAPLDPRAAPDTVRR